MIWQNLLEGLGSVLSFFYDVIPSYGVAIILLTLAVRVVLIPLTIKQTRSMHAMQKIQPQLKALQQKHKGDRQKLNEEVMKLYKEHQVNPLGGCLPLLLQLPVFIALFSVLRTATVVTALPADPVSFGSVAQAFCIPAGDPHPAGPGPSSITCETPGGNESIPITRWTNSDGERVDAPPYLVRCAAVEPKGGQRVTFRCESPVGTDHLPESGSLFASIVEGRAEFVGMHLSCGATQVISPESIRLCAPEGTKAGGFPVVGYYGLIALMVFTTFYQQKQMQASTGQQAAQQQLMMKIMPVFLGFISLSIPAGVLIYWVTTNLWQVGQQAVMLRSRAKETSAPAKAVSPPPRTTPPKPSGRKNAGSRKKRRKR